VATRRNDDGSFSLVSIDPTLFGLEWVIGKRGAKRVLLTRDGQHDYAFVED
jgi:hypothetical protein